MNKLSTRVLLLTTFAVLLLSPVMLYAEDGGGHGGKQLVDLGWRTLNFLIFVAILYFAAAKPVKNFLNGRIEGIKSQLDGAEKARDDAEKKSKEYLQKLENLEEEIKEIKDTLKLEGEVERDRIIEAAHDAAEKLKKQAEFSSGQELKKAIIAIREETAVAAVSLAEKLLQDRMKENDQKKLVDEYIDNVRGMN